MFRVFPLAFRLGRNLTTAASVESLPQLHPLLIQRAQDLTKQQHQLQAQLETYDAELQEKYDRISHILDKFNQFSQLKQEIVELASIREPELLEDAQEELASMIPRYTSLTKELSTNLLPRVKYAEKGCIVELRPGIGGSEASLFTDDLMQMYINFCVVNKWKYEIVSRATSSSGYVNECILSVTHGGSFDILRHESGVHRVQRIPSTESKGRIHTSTSAVVVLPQLSEGTESSLKDDEMQFAPGEIRVDTMRAGGKGGQHVNTTDSAVRVVHLPTGIQVVQQDERSQPQNKAKAFAILRARLAEKERVEEMNKQKQMRTSQVSSTDRSDKIRTYNWPQNRITDHRCGFSLHDIDGCMSGSRLMEIINRVAEVEYQQRLEDLLSDTGDSGSSSSSSSSS
ncbi:uncharacterized protein LODBEIA_P51680 [Lodderomyces beijingensis]|uniref:Prokaryotic-type class I peptide chain release factors domain-containing protein n=1 Tax=Lodderomyces beijingensis TaxID=1775926 RepID=A0ABP0ZS45_9ASCO